MFILVRKIFNLKYFENFRHKTSQVFEYIYEKDYMYSVTN